MEEKHYRTLDEAILHSPCPNSVRENLILLSLPFIDFNEHERVGQLVVHRALAKDVEDIFSTLLKMRFPIEKMIPIVAYAWDDVASMEDNNTSSFNYRVIMGTDRLSNHSYGEAIDINPLLNPYFARDGKVYPEGAVFDTNIKGTVTPEVVDLFTSHGWTWGGHWESVKDYQHFEKKVV